MKNWNFTIVTSLLMIIFVSCRGTTDKLYSYDHEDQITFSSAEHSFAEKFSVLWNGLNQYYPIWDYEAEFGLDWDAVGKEYYPQFQALDRQETVSDDELQALMGKMCAPLHDGHIMIAFSNHKTGTQQVTYSPNNERIKSRDDYQVLNRESMYYYYNAANGEIMTDTAGYPIMKHYSTSPKGFLNTIFYTPTQGIVWIYDQINELKKQPTLTEAETIRLQQLENLFYKLLSTLDLETDSAIELYNQLVEEYASLQVPGLDHFDATCSDHDITLKYGLFKGNIAYLYINIFNLSYYLDGNYTQKAWGSSEAAAEHIKRIKEVWDEWFNTVQRLHKEGTLGGVIIDVRGNPGGNTNDFKYIPGSLLPSGGFQIGYNRIKSGPGRYDFTPLSLNVKSTMDEAHEVITEPVVILTNCNTTSMAEHVTLAVKAMPNGTVIGKRTHGAIGSMFEDGSNYSIHYTGHIGVPNKTPVYVRMPWVATLTLDKKIIEGVGIAPDIEVDLDANLCDTKDRDTQLERALQFIRDYSGSNGPQSWCEP